MIRRPCGTACLPVLGHNRFALCALDEAAHDLWGKLRGAPVWKLWGLDLRDLPLSDYTIGIDTVEKMVVKMKEFDGWPIYKIKLGTKNDLAIVQRLAPAHAGHLSRRCQHRLDRRGNNRHSRRN